MKEREKPRRCRECTECCTVLSVHEMEKPADTACTFCTRGGCSIYEARPGSCRTFTCAWLQGLFADKDRPDRLGVIFAAQDTRIGHTLVVFEIREGAVTEPRPTRYICNARDAGIPVVIFHYGNKKRSIVADRLDRAQVDDLIDDVRSARGLKPGRKTTIARPASARAAADILRHGGGSAQGEK